MNYKIVEKDKKFLVIETKTDQVIDQYNTRQEAKEQLRFLNLGGAFDGFSPSFILKKNFLY
jgi:hypothetical protein